MIPENQIDKKEKISQNIVINKRRNFEPEQKIKIILEVLPEVTDSQKMSKVITKRD